MGDFKINEKTVFTQSGGGEPAMGSTITDIPAAGLTGTIPSGVTFPAGHILQVVQHTLASADGQPTITSTGPVSFSTAFKKSITITAGNTILITTSLCITKTGGIETYFHLYDDTLDVYVPGAGADGHFGGAVSADSQFVQMSYSILYTPALGTVHDIEVRGGATNVNTLTMNKQHSQAAQGRMSSTLILMEIQI